MVRVEIMKPGDEVLSITDDFIAVKRANGEVDIVPILVEAFGPRVDTEKIVRIGYGDNTITRVTEDGVRIVHF